MTTVSEKRPQTSDKAPKRAHPARMSLAELRYHLANRIDRFFFRLRYRGRELVDGTINRGQLRYAQQLVWDMARKHYGRDPADGFVTFDDIAGCLTQIDNMSTGLSRVTFLFDDGREFKLTGVAGGAAPEGEFSTVTCELRQADGRVRVLHYAVQPDDPE